MASDTSKSIRTNLVGVQRALVSWSHTLAVRSREKPGSVDLSEGSTGQMGDTTAKFFSPENEDFPYHLV